MKTMEAVKEARPVSATPAQEPQAQPHKGRKGKKPTKKKGPKSRRPPARAAAVEAPPAWRQFDPARLLAPVDSAFDVAHTRTIEGVPERFLRVLLGQVRTRLTHSLALEAPHPGSHDAEKIRDYLRCEARVQAKPVTPRDVHLFAAILLSAGQSADDATEFDRLAREALSQAGTAREAERRVGGQEGAERTPCSMIGYTSLLAALNLHGADLTEEIGIRTIAAVPIALPQDPFWLTPQQLTDAMDNLSDGLRATAGDLPDRTAAENLLATAQDCWAHLLGSGVELGFRGFATRAAEVRNLVEALEGAKKHLDDETQRRTSDAACAELMGDSPAPSSKGKGARERRPVAVPALRTLTWAQRVEKLTPGRAVPQMPVSSAEDGWARRWCAGTHISPTASGRAHFAKRPSGYTDVAAYTAAGYALMVQAEGAPPEARHRTWSHRDLRPLVHYTSRDGAAFVIYDATRRQLVTWGHNQAAVP